LECFEMGMMVIEAGPGLRGGNLMRTNVGAAIVAVAFPVGADLASGSGIGSRRLSAVVSP
jgi:hypothetical protein